MKHLLYDTATTLAVPFGVLYLAVSPRHRPLLGRFRPAVPALEPAPVWVHACSVGEMAVAKALLHGFGARWPATPILLTASTVTGGRAAARVADSQQGAAFAWFPFDQSQVVKGFFKRARPQALLLVETELWPNVLREAARRGVPSVLVNARLSDRRFPVYRRFARWFGEVFRQLDGVAAQNAEYAERFRSLGVPAERVQVTGNIKFDGVRTAVSEERKAELRAVARVGPAQPVVVFGSTRPGDEAMAAACWHTLRGTHKDMVFVVAPRHLERVSEACAAFDGKVVLRSSLGGLSESAGRPRVIIIDTMGELADFYAIATAAVVGGSFSQEVQGHNPLEPAALGTTTVFGPHMRNFIDPARVLVDAGGAVQVMSREDVAGVLCRVLRDDDARAELGERGRQAVLGNQGATERTLDFVAPFLAEAAK